MDLLKNFKKFLDKNLDITKPLLLAYSGGTDSACLLDLILKVKDEYKIDLHIAHVNHGWRIESDREAVEIQKKMEKLNISFHLKKLKLNVDKNLENESRLERLAFFRYLFKKYDFQALIEAHQKDDLAETILKRFLEGANIFSLTSMVKISKFDDMIIWRPLLEVSRAKIYEHLKQNRVSCYKDISNEDTKFLRAKMRKDIFPFLQKNFNKQILDNLAHISTSSLELNEYLESKTRIFIKKIKISPFGLYIDLNEVSQSIELKFILKKIANLQKIDLSRSILEKLVFWLMQKKPNLRLNLKNGNVFADRGCFFILKKDYKAFREKILIKEGIFDVGPWKVEIKRIKKGSNESFSSNWKDLFSNNLCIYLPESKYYMNYPEVGNNLKKVWENYKVPSFLRRVVPIVCGENKVTYDFLSGKKKKLNNKNVIKIVIKLK